MVERERGQWAGESPVQHQAALTGGWAIQPSAGALDRPQHGAGERPGGDRGRAGLGLTERSGFGAGHPWLKP